MVLFLDPTVVKSRRKLIPPVPDSSLFDIPDEFQLTMDKERFLFIDEICVRRERLLIFASNVQLDLLFNSSTIY